LDLKTEAINRYIETIINNHITSPDIHFSWGDVEYLVTSTIGAAGLSRNTVVTLPIYKSYGKNYTINYILSRIRQIPHNLNGYTLLLMFAIPVSEVTEIKEDGERYCIRLR
jgi:hypothetical protein